VNKVDDFFGKLNKCPMLKTSILITLLVLISTSKSYSATANDKLATILEGFEKPSTEFTLQGWADHTTTMVTDSTRTDNPDGDDLLVHTSRFMVGARGILNSGNLRYSILGGGTSAANSIYDQRILTPEYQTELDWNPIEPLTISVFSRYGWRRPNQFISDSLRRRDWVNGLKLGISAFSNTDLSLVGGNRRVFLEHDHSDHRYFKGELVHRLPFLKNFQIRAQVESDWYGLTDSLDFQQQRTLGGLILNGQLPANISVYSYNGQVYREGVKRWVFNDRVRIDSFKNHRINLTAATNWTTIQDSDVYHRRYDVNWKWDLTKYGGLTSRIAGENVEQDNVYSLHNRNAAGGIFWLAKPVEHFRKPESNNRITSTFSDLRLRGHLLAGLKQTGEFGDGITTDAKMELTIPMRLTRWLTVDLNNFSDYEIFKMQDGKEHEDYSWGEDVNEQQQEFSNRLILKTTVFPQSQMNFGVRAEWNRHTGTELVFSSDTLRNTLNTEIWLRMSHYHQRITLRAMSVDHLDLFGDLKEEYRLSLRWSYRATRLLILNTRAVWRPKRGAYEDRLWIRGYGEFELRKLHLALDLRFSGDPSNFGSRDTQLWVHVIRRLWW
jgi:hypothetical protein